MHATYQFRGATTKAGYERLDDVLRLSRFLYNAALQDRRDAFRRRSVPLDDWDARERRLELDAERKTAAADAGEQWTPLRGWARGRRALPDECLPLAIPPVPTRIDQQKQFTNIRKDDPEWSALSVHVGRGVLRRLDRAFQNFFRRVKAGEKPGYPRFKSAQGWNTIEIDEPSPSMIRDNGRHYLIRVKGLPLIKLRKRRELPLDRKLVNLTVTHRGRRLICNLTYEVEQEPLPPVDAAVGIDVGVADRAMLSDGTAFPRRPPRARAIEKKQKRLSACRKGSRERRRRARILANAHYRERVRARNETHRITTEIVRRFGLVAIENLNVGAMTASAAGTTEEPGTNVSAKSGLNRSILEQSWGMMRQQLAYKAAWAGRELIAVDPAHTSQTCSRCGVVDRTNRSGKEYRCGECGLAIDADLNAARNILARALAGVENPERFAVPDPPQPGEAA